MLALELNCGGCRLPIQTHAESKTGDLNLYKNVKNFHTFSENASLIFFYLTFSSDLLKVDCIINFLL